MLTSHNLFISQKWDRFLLANGVVKKAPNHLSLANGTDSFMQMMLT